MKKSLLYLFTVLCTLSFFTSCGDDDEKPNEDWKNISKEYTGESLKVTGGAAGNVEVKATSDKAATIVLTNVVPDAATVNIEAALAGTSLSGETTVSGCLVKVAGTIDAKGALALTVTREITSPVVGDWNLNIVEAGPAKIASVYLGIKTGVPAIDGQAPMLQGAVGGMIGSKVSAVSSSLKKDGTVAISWSKDGKPDPMGAMISGLLTYSVGEGQIFLNIDKAMLTTVLSTFGEQLAAMGIKAEDILKLLVDKGGFYALPLNFKIEGSNATFYLAKEQIVPMLTAFGPMVNGMIDAALANPETNPEMLPLLGGLKAMLPLIPTAQQFDLGLVFSK